MTARKARYIFSRHKLRNESYSYGADPNLFTLFLLKYPKRNRQNFIRMCSLLLEILITVFAFLRIGFDCFLNLEINQVDL